ncbi:DUF2956 family protein [Photobacterium phosphoreum]|mgnify:CR=1 FL=1|jgi:hypothetical protein|uniref:DUF2956 family protein n=1 Tax=Photobacterium phosphoreum TaxID=659 RepID=A0AAW4ZTL9_PHOPO|nr:DUF2956 domain-containing protein [Photobacterium phosphoreum]MCD9470649.1 DUF2956 domain-containing protein [Photobacterium phosphoreum]MCD9473232.1 DUF2956 family protein [Photobacterium phosphoreum]MCD9478244.1 DUF2956 family protein [Photobacterium phosphoreum]MCD9489270.1 DUF2956 family protein [Photobacterium phosphoreum]MCD9500640.1 DUF2956 family protein [Photobacterium phosphoreum]
MATIKKNATPSAETQIEALRVAKATQKEGQTKEQTKLIAQGIQKGIEQYKKQQKSKARDRDKLKKKTTQSKNNQSETIDNPLPAPQIIYKQHWLPWGIIVASWIGFGAYLAYSNVL